ncbi:uncharacterized protein LOC143180090 [Calliopsis andreniformis]|uniref:uncharacterized protein LOC143180090 n=1 Tax=Calliopsis andreniformis TaxID=337506 RepID=UPI003FCDC778
MDQFITTYQKDYTWPSTRIKYPSSLLRKDGSCPCRSDSSREIKVIDLCGDQQDWSRVGPMGRLLDPKLYPAKTGPHPETEVTKHDQPSVYMKKLEEKYPNLYGILQKTPMEEIIMRVDQDRLRTTYQVDYSDSAAAAMAEESTLPCAPIKRPVEDIDCRPSTRSRVKKGEKKDREDKRKPKKKGEDESQETRIPPWRSEYQDSISRLGHAIIKTNMHHKRTPAPAWAMSA